MPSHKPGTLKQVNKKHKGKTGKRAQNRSFGPGRVANSKGQSQNNDANSRKERLNKSHQERKKKQSEVVMQRRIGAKKGCPKIVAVVPLSTNVNVNECILRGITGEADTNNGASSQSVLNVFMKKQKTQCTFVTNPTRDVISILDIAKVADVILLVTGVANNSSASAFDTVGLDTLTCLKALGSPEMLLCVDGYDKSAPQKVQQAVKKEVQSIADHYLPDVKVLDSNNAFQFCNAIANAGQKLLSWRQHRSYFISSDVELLPDKANEPNSDRCNVRIGAYIRGVPLNVNSMVHFVGVGMGQISRISMDKISDGSREDSFFHRTIYADDFKREEPWLVEAIPDELMGEQTWPAESEMADGDVVGDSESKSERKAKVMTNYDGDIYYCFVKLPKGMSEYQADWFRDDDGAIDTEEFGDDDDGNSILDGSQSINGLAVDLATAAESKRMLRSFAKEDLEFPDEVDTPVDVAARVRFARYRALQSFRTSAWHSKENLPANYSRIFQFENVKSLQKRVLSEVKDVGKLQHQSDGEVILTSRAASKVTSIKGDDTRMEEEDSSIISEEDEMEEAPGMLLDGNKVVALSESKLQNSTSNSVKAPIDPAAFNGISVPCAEKYARTGLYVFIDVEGVPKDILEKVRDSGFVSCFSLLQHENKLSVLHFNIRKSSAITVNGEETTMAIDNKQEENVIKSKDKLLFMTGFRSFFAKPIFSESNLNCDKHKMERFLQDQCFSVATCYGPITFSYCPLLVFKQSEDGILKYVANGSLMSIDPDRIILKKIILTGIPIRVRKSFAVVKHMFYNSQDIKWFKPAELATKHGLRGHIKESVGLHGLYKAHFSSPIKQNDTVMLVLYKRVFPKIPEEGIILK